MLKSVYFSPSGSTKKVVDFIVEELDIPSEPVDFTVSAMTPFEIKEPDRVMLFAAPVYAGRVPRLARERFSAVKGRGQKAIVLVVYGNRDFDDALLELCDLVTSLGFEVVAAAAFVAQHCIFPKVAAGRPDAEDKEKMSIFASKVREALSSGSALDTDIVSGERPYRRPGGVPIHPSVIRSLCNSCGVCASECPTGAISRVHPDTTDTSKCISCCRCINVCPRDARHFRGLLYKIASWKFTRDNARRLEPTWFF